MKAGGLRVEGLPLAIDGPGVYGFCFTAGEAWVMLQQPVVVHGPVVCARERQGQTLCCLGGGGGWGGGRRFSLLASF